MVGIIRELKDQLLESMDKDVQERGSADRLDPDMVDMVKDLAEAEKACMEAEYYKTVIGAMQGQSGYSGYGDNGQMSRSAAGYNGRSGWENQYGRGYSRRGYESSSMGHGNAVDGIRNIMMTASPDEKERMKNELRSILGM